MNSEFIVWDSLVALKLEVTKPTLYVVHGANHNILMFNALTQRLHKDQPVYGLQSKGLNGIDEPHDSIDQMGQITFRKLSHPIQMAVCSRRFFIRRYRRFRNGKTIKSPRKRSDNCRTI